MSNLENVALFAASSCGSACGAADPKPEENLHLPAVQLVEQAIRNRSKIRLVRYIAYQCGHGHTAFLCVHDYTKK